MRQSLGQAVSNHFIGWHVREVNPSSGYLISDIVVLDVDMLRSRVEDRVVGESDGALIVSPQWDCVGDEVQSSSLWCDLADRELFRFPLKSYRPRARRWCC